jgi:2-keto-4-pentenoate hydratase
MSDHSEAGARIAAIAAKLAADWEPRAPYEALTGDLKPTDLDEAYQAQAALQERLTALRGPVVGRKIALSSKAMQQMCGIDHPIAGAIFARDVVPNGAAVTLRQFRRMGIEYELAFELDQDVGPDTDAPTRDTVLALVARVRPAFELIEDKGADYARLDIMTLVADNAWCGGVVLGPEIAGWRALDLADLPAVLHQDGHEPEPANTGAADPLGSLVWVLNHCRALGQTVRKGEVVITGSVLRTRFPAAGDRFRYEVAGRAAVELSIV